MRTELRQSVRLVALGSHDRIGPWLADLFPVQNDSMLMIDFVEKDDRSRLKVTIITGSNLSCCALCLVEKAVN